MNVEVEDAQFLSDKPIPRRERLVFALDVHSIDEAKALVERLDDSVVFYKLGLQLFMAGDYFELVDWLRGRGKKVFVDLKFFDVPNTVASAVERLSDKGASFTTVHGNDAMLEAAVNAVPEKSELKILAVTVLTSMDQEDMEALGFQRSIEKVVLSRALKALELGCHGVISSGWEARQLRANLGTRFLIISPGIRPGDNVEIENDDQKRIRTPREAFFAGADYLVIGRPIRNAPDPYQAAMKIQHEIESIFPR